MVVKSGDACCFAYETLRFGIKMCRIFSFDLSFLETIGTIGDKKLLLRGGRDRTQICAMPGPEGPLWFCPNFAIF